MVEGSALWFGAAGFEVLGVAEVGAELVVEVETTRAVTGCSTCGTRGAEGPAVGHGAGHAGGVAPGAGAVA